jgi:hypothetical protein
MKINKPTLETIVRSNTAHYGGGTWYFEGKPTEKRYIVGDGNLGFVMPEKEFLQGITLGAKLDQYIKAWKHCKGCNFHGFGTWINPEDRTVYIDPIHTFNSLGKALNLAQKNGETCIFDTETDQTIGV